MALKDNLGIYASITPCAGDAVVGLHPACYASGIFRNREVNEAFMDPAFRRRLEFISADIFPPHPLRESKFNRRQQRFGAESPKTQ